MSKYLLEIGTEELPANFSHSVLNQFKSQIEFEFDRKLIKFEKIFCTSTPRRIVLLLEGLIDRGEDEMIIRKGPKASSAFINGIFSLDDNKQHEIRTTINHLVENTKSYQLIKSVLGKNTKSAYQGRIYVDSKAQKTDGYQLSKAILLDETSEFNAKPELEIYADDVKCSHGSASGSLDDNSIFYLMSRGLNYKQAKGLLINGFLLDVIEKITDAEIKDLLKKMIGLKK